VTAGIGERRLYLCTPDRSDLASFVESTIRGGVDVVQLREKDLGAKALLRRAAIVRRVCAAHGVPFIVNDRPDLALEAGADGVHLGQEDAPSTLARRLLGPDAIIGLSTHSPEDLDGALDQPVDYLSAGPVVPTPTKPGRPGTGTDYLTLAADRSPRPVFVTGGVTPETVGGLVACGARHFVVVRFLTESSDPERSARALRRAIARALEPSDQRS
jgi:thiamine-phosphate pyrophosphorylase